ncbi:hypothetical protein THAOC_23039 [Thalassiosira oceanica]|uniref:Uncharacterized protein n=1 Tax=Thalassiosira oceanica TaxID=159749 RepID=K0RVD6_THAOC|nr:hypothetical protein THAOC_23039 [Thalassiosira oceanica]|eukprot:EJK56970.1 hypothetical protein THAOC_23039 [Thalassiosira oceanica]
MAPSPSHQHVASETPILPEWGRCEALPIKKVNIHRSFGPSMVYRSGVSNLPFSGSFHTATETKPAPAAAGRERKDKAALSLGAGEALIPARLLPGRVRPDHLPPRHQQPRRTGRPNMSIGRRTTGRRSSTTRPGARRRGEDGVGGLGDRVEHHGGSRQLSLPHTTDNTPDSSEAPQPSSSSVLNESDHLKSPGIIPGAVSVEPVHRDSSHVISDRTDEVAERMLVDARRIRNQRPSRQGGEEGRLPQPYYESHQQGYLAA